jgi:hypothetical protein
MATSQRRRRRERGRPTTSDSCSRRSSTESVLGSVPASAVNTASHEGASARSRQAANTEIIRDAARSNTLHNVGAVHFGP